MFTIASNGTVQADFAALTAKARKMSNAALRYSIDDARQAERANPEGAKAGYYLDECHTYSSELVRRGL
jgi:hypothetical protein